MIQFSLIMLLLAAACAPASRSPDLTALAQRVADAVVRDSPPRGSGGRAIELAGGPTPFDSVVRVELARRGTLRSVEGGPQATSTLRTEGVSFRGDTALVAVDIATCDPAENTPGWGSRHEYRFVPEPRWTQRGRAGWRELVNQPVALYMGAACPDRDSAEGGIELASPAG